MKAEKGNEKQLLKGTEQTFDFVLYFCFIFCYNHASVRLYEFEKGI